MGAPLVRLPSERIAHALGVPLEYMEMRQDVAGMADMYSAGKYAGSATSFPPEVMSIDKVDSGVVRYNDYLPPEFGWAPIAKVEHANTLLPTSQEGRMGSPENMRVVKQPPVMARSEFNDTYPAMSDNDPSVDSDDLINPDIMQLNPQAESSIYGTFVDGSLADDGSDAEKAKQLEALKAAQAAQAARRKNVLLALGGIAALYFLLRKGS